MIDRVINGVVNGLYVKMCINYIYIYKHITTCLYQNKGDPAVKPYHGHNGLKMDRQKGQPNERQKLHISNFSLSPLSKFREKPEQTIKTNRSWFYCINHHIVSQIPIKTYEVSY